MNATKDKVKELKLFLRKRKVKYKDIAVSDSTTLNLGGAYITSRSSYYQKFSEYDIDPLMFEMIKKYLQEINMSQEIDSYSLQFEKHKLNSLLIKMDHTIKNKNLNVLFQRNSTFGGYTETRKKIVLFDPSDELFSQYLKIVPGINYHELAHVLYTCSFKRLFKDLVEKYAEYDNSIYDLSNREQKSVVGAVLRIVNAFEDGRAESLMGNRMGNSISYFKNTFYNFLFSQMQEKLDAGEPIDELDCVLVAGRKYLDPELRKWIFDKYMETDEEHTEEKAKRVNAYINKFVTSSWRKNREEMMDLALGFFFEFIKPKLEDQQKSDWEEQIMKMLKDAATALNQMGEGDEEIDESEENILKKIIKETLENNTTPQKKKGKKGKEDGEGEGDEKGKNKGKKDDKASHSAGDEEDQREADNRVNEIVNNDKQEIEKDINEQTKNLESKLNSVSIEQKDNSNFDDKNVTNDMKKDKMALEKKLKEFMRHCRNGYDIRKKKGAVDIGEARRQSYRGGMKIFRQYRKNVRKALDIDVAFVLDCSYSMSGGHSVSKINEASKQLWIAASACSNVGAKVKIFTFSDYFLGTVDQPKSNLVYRVPYYVNGTTISDTLCIAENYLQCSQANTKWLIVLTDGAIADPNLHDLIIQRVKTKGATCGKINLTDDRDYYYDTNDSEYDHVLKMSHNGDGSTNILEGQNIVTFFQKIYDVSFNRTGRKFV